LSMSKLFSLELADTSLACVCYLGQPSNAKIQHTVRGLSKRTNGARILLTLLGTETAKSVESATSARVTGGSFAAALEAIVKAISEQPVDASSRKAAAAV
jgi:hypothetical protein